MIGPTTKRARWRLAVVAALVALTSTGCADDPAPSESAPALEDSLSKVDAAIEAGEFDEARRAVKDLISDAAQARVDGDIDDEEADRIFDAAQEVLAVLPDQDEKESASDDSDDD